MELSNRKSLELFVPIELNQLATTIDNADVFYQMGFSSGSIVALVESEKYSVEILVFGEHKSYEIESGELLHKDPNRLLELLEGNDHQDFIVDSCWLAYDVYDKVTKKTYLFSHNDTYGSIQEILGYVSDEKIYRRINYGL